MTQKGSQLIGGAVTEEVLASSKSILSASKYTSEKGLQQFFTPESVARWISRVTLLGQPVLDPTAGAGNLLKPHSAGLRYGIEIDKDWTGKDCSYDAIQADLQELYPLAKRIGLTFPLILANPPFGLSWHEPTLNDGKPINSTVLCYQYCLNLLDEYGQGVFICGRDRLDREILPLPEASQIYAIVDVPDLFGKAVDLPCSISFFAKSRREPISDPFRVERKSAQLDEELARRIYSEKNATCTLVNLYEQSEVQRLWKALREEVKNRKKKDDAPEYNLTIQARRMRIHFRAYQEIAFHRHDRHLLQMVKNLDGLNPTYFAVNRGFWKDCQKLIEGGYLTIGADAKADIDKIIDEADLSTCPLYPIKPQQRLGFLTDAEAVLCTQSNPDMGIEAGKRYPVFARSRVQTEHGKKPNVTLSGEVEMQEYKKTRKVLEIRITPDEGHDSLCLTESEEHLRFLVEHFDMPDPGNLGSRFPQKVEEEHERLDGIAKRYGFGFRDFQREDIARLLVKGGGVLCWEQGCGKTLGGMAFAKGIMGKSIAQSARRVLFIVPQDLVPQWQREAQRFFKQRLDIIGGVADARRVYRRFKQNPSSGGWYITWYEALSRNGRLSETLPEKVWDSGRKVRRWNPETDEYEEHKVMLSSREFCPGCQATTREGWSNPVCDKCGYTHFRCRVKPAYTWLTNCFKQGVIVVDEGTKIKADDSLTSLAVRGLRCKHKLLLTGTPVRNYIPDAFWLLWWGLGNNTPRFPFDYENGKTKFTQDFAVIEATYKEGKKTREKVLPEVTNLAILWRLLASSIIRRRKEETGENLVPRIFHEIRVPFGTEQRQQYKKWLKGFADWYVATHETDMGIAMVERMSAILGLYWKLQFTATLPYCQSEDSWWRSPNMTPKNLAVVQQAIECVKRGEQVVVFSSLMEYGPLIAGLLNEAGISACHIVKSVGEETTTKSPGERADLVTDFRRGKFSVLCAGINAMSLGHNLDNASSVIVSGLPWDYTTFDQAIARAHRLTSKREVHIYVALTSGSIDEKMWDLIKDKEAAASLALDGRLFEQEEQEIDLQKFLDDLKESWQEDGVTVDEAEVEDRLDALISGAPLDEIRKAYLSVA
jgi:superfamily II DNA or RNA helicase